MFNKTEIYNAKIKAKVDELKKICYEAGIPMFVSCAVADDGEKTEFKNEMVSALAARTNLTQDLIADFVIVLNGGVIHAADLEEIEF